MSSLGTGLLKKMLINDVRSRNVYENKGSTDKVTTKKSDIYDNLTWILQKNSGFDRQLSLIDTSRAGLVRIFAAKIHPSPGRAPSAAQIPSARGSVKTTLSKLCGERGDGRGFAPCSAERRSLSAEQGAKPPVSTKFANRDLDTSGGGQPPFRASHRNASSFAGG